MKTRVGVTDSVLELLQRPKLSRDLPDGKTEDGSTDSGVDVSTAKPHMFTNP